MSEQRPDEAAGEPRQPEQGAVRPAREPYYEGYFGTEEEEGAVRLQDDAEVEGEPQEAEPPPAPREAGPGESIIDPARRNPEAPANVHDRTPSGEEL